MIHYCIPTIRRFDCLIRCIESTLSGTRAPDVIHVIDNSCGKLDLNLFNQSEIIRDSDVPIKLIRPERNLGVAGSWNCFYDMIGEDFIILSNDDVEISETLIEDFERAALTDIRHGMFCPTGQGENIYSLFMLRYHAYKLIGRFDENFWPAYFEDNDYDFRRKLFGIRLARLETCSYKHVGSATLKSYNNAEMNMHHENFRKNEQYYIRKWGARCGSEEMRKFVDEPVR